jgi:hypothetical protein
VFRLLHLPDRPSWEEFLRHQRSLYTIYSEPWIDTLPPLLKYVYTYKMSKPGRPEEKWKRFLEGLRAVSESAGLNVGNQRPSKDGIGKNTDEQIIVSS